MAFTTYMPQFTDDTTAIPAAYLNQLRVDIGRAIDGTNGGSYAPSSAINVQGSGFGTINLATLLDIKVGGQLVCPVGATIPDLPDNETFTLAQGQIRMFAANGAGRIHDLSNTGATDGSWIHFIGLPGNAGTIDINRSGFGATHIVTLPAGNWSCATVYFDGLGAWRLLRTEGGTPGADA